MKGGEGDEGEDGGGAEPAPGHQGVHHQAEGCRAHSPPGITTCTLYSAAFCMAGKTS